MTSVDKHNVSLLLCHSRAFRITFLLNEGHNQSINEHNDGNISDLKIEIF